MRENKGALVIIIILMVISIPTSIFGIGYKVYSKFHKPPEAPKPVIKPFYENGTLNFYSFNTLAGTYTCENIDGYCGWAYEMIDDNNYSIDYYDDLSVDMMNLINGRYAFIVDTIDQSDDKYRNSEIILYDVLESKVLAKYAAVKNYSIGLENDYYIVKDLTGKWGVIKLASEEFNVVIPFDYEYIGVQNQLANASSYLSSDMFVVKNTNGWLIIDKNGVPLSSSFINQIYQYDNNVLIVNNGFAYSLYDYTGRKLLSNDYKQLKLVGKYVATYDSYGYFALMNYNTNEQVTSKKVSVSSLADVTFNTNDDGSIDVIVSGSYLETIK